MAKLTDRQKVNIQSKWDTGNYTKSELAKQYRVDEKTIRKIVGTDDPKNVDIVKAQTELEFLKKSINLL